MPMGGGLEVHQCAMVGLLQDPPHLWLSLKAGVFKLALEHHQHCTFCMSPLLDTPNPVSTKVELGVKSGGDTNCEVLQDLSENPCLKFA